MAQFIENKVENIMNMQNNWERGGRKKVTREAGRKAENVKVTFRMCRRRSG